MMTISKPDVNIYTAFVHYAKFTGESVLINDLTIADDSRCYISLVEKCEDEDAGFKITPFFITGEHHDSIMKRIDEDLLKVTELLREETAKLKQVEKELSDKLYEDEDK